MIYSFTGLKYHRPSSKVMFYVATFDRQETDTPPQKKSKFFNSPITKGSYCEGGEGGGRGRREVRPGDYKLHKLQRKENRRNPLSVFHDSFSFMHAGDLSEKA